MTDAPKEISTLESIEPGVPDDALVLAASWEERCLSLPTLSPSYRCKTVFLTVYDGPSDLREKHIQMLDPILSKLGTLEHMPATHADPLSNVRSLINNLRQLAPGHAPRISIEISTFTRKHLLLLLSGLDHAGLLRNCQIFYTEPQDYQTHEDEAAATGISAIETIPTFAGSNRPSKNSLLVMFLGYEGRRTLALWEHLEPHSTVAVIADPPYHPDWRGRTELQNRYLLSCIPQANVFYSHSLYPNDTDALLVKLIQNAQFDPTKYDYWIAPFGTRPQLLGVYKFWRKQPGFVNIVYARPVRYRQEYRTIAAGRSWCLDQTSLWPIVDMSSCRLGDEEVTP